ncbi:MAG: hypothetical protein COB36_04585 [Alphaproteobacteria bacterium]|nr:MAG: hypothetical protein COB36_04585 [Alphaproteobacteria bacterium]
MAHCKKTSCIFYGLTILANIIMIIVTLFIVANSYGGEARMALILLIPPILSLLALRKGGDKEERALKSRIRKANLRKELDDLKKFDKTD